jgi:Phosphoketolase
MFDKTGRLKPELAELPPKGNRRMSANPHANGGFYSEICDFRTSVTTPST